ncbi:MAG TPA: hypothetical protein VMW25_00265 [Clostridia bacterium]|nr:hypothetical protein [Clostridia bacterium]
MFRKVVKVFLVLGFIFLLVNLLVLDYFWFSSKKALTGASFTASLTPSLACEEACQETIAEKIKEELAKITPEAGQSSVSFSPTPILWPTKVSVVTEAKAKVVYIPLVSSGSTVSTTWADIVPSEFYFDLSDYPLAKEVKFETYLLALHGSAKVYARLYDQTNKRGVDYSDLETQSPSFVRVESSPIVIWRGNNKYTIQLRSANGTEVQLQEAKLKVVF